MKQRISGSLSRSIRNKAACKMNTIIRYITTDEKKNTEIFDKARDVLKNGGLVSFPTETVYGLGADALNPAACKKIYEAKGRPSDNPLIVHAASLKEARSVAVFDKRAEIMAQHFWPGPLTLVLKKQPCVPDEVTGGLDTVAVRVPCHSTARKLLEQSGMFIAAPSANLSGRPSPTQAAHVIDDMDGRIDMIIADDSVNVGLESTIIDMTVDIPVILRPGAVTKEDAQEVLGENVTFAKEDAGEGSPKAPGMKYRHYAPRAEMHIVWGDVEKMSATINEMAAEAGSEGRKVFILSGDDTADRYTSGEVVCLGGNGHEVSVNLFKALRRCDDEGADVILSEGFEETGIGRAIMNRLIKASGNNIIRV